MSISHVPMSQVYLPPFVFWPSPWVVTDSQQTSRSIIGSKTTQKVGFRSASRARSRTLNPNPTYLNLAGWISLHRRVAPTTAIRYMYLYKTRAMNILEASSVSSSYTCRRYSNKISADNSNNEVFRVQPFTPLPTHPTAAQPKQQYAKQKA